MSSREGEWMEIVVDVQRGVSVRLRGGSGRRRVSTREGEWMEMVLDVWRGVSVHLGGSVGRRGE